MILQSSPKSSQNHMWLLSRAAAQRERSSRKLLKDASVFFKDFKDLAAHTIQKRWKKLVRRGKSTNLALKRRMTLEKVEISHVASTVLTGDQTLRPSAVDHATADQTTKVRKAVAKSEVESVRTDLAQMQAQLLTLASAMSDGFQRIEANTARAIHQAQNGTPSNTGSTPAQPSSMSAQDLPLRPSFLEILSPRRRAPRQSL